MGAAANPHLFDRPQHKLTLGGCQSLSELSLVSQMAKVHAFYILLILGAVIVGLVTVAWLAIPQLAELITFALTVT